VRYPALAADVTLTEADGGWLVRQPGRGRVHYLNDSAALALTLCTGRNEWQEIVALVCGAAGRTADAGGDVDALLARALAEGLVVVT
jgi:hypothetical protein